MSVNVGGVKNNLVRKLSRGLSVRPNDNAPEWNLSQLYGREEESRIIQDHIDKNASSTLIVKGVSGSGKSSLIESQDFEKDGWVVSSGKYDKRRKQEPYSALIDALDSIVDQWMTNNNIANVCRMASFSNLLEEDLKFLEKILPKTFHVVKAWKMAAEKCPLEHSHSGSITKSETMSEAEIDAGTMNSAFWRIFSFLCEAKPVVLHLDDIHWADQSSLDAIQALSSAGNIKGFFLVLSYRIEEVSDGDSVLKCLEFIQEESERVETISIANLDVENTNKIVSALLNQDPGRTIELASLIHTKTAGNPFFVLQLVQMLRHKRFLKYNRFTLRWEYKMDQLAFVSDNVADVIAASMSKLSEKCLIALQTASCLGNVVPLQVIIKYLHNCADDENLCDHLKGIRVDELRQVFDDAVRFGILTQLDDGVTFTWAHDKLQRVAYSMIPVECLETYHKSLGMILWDMHKLNPENEWMLYMAADQLNHLTDSTDDSGNIARLSFQAGQLSISKAAFFSALDMIRFAAKRIDIIENSWELDYDLCLNVYSTLAQLSIRFLSCHDEALDAAMRVCQHAKTLEDKIRAQIILIRHKVEGSNRDYKGGVESIRNILLDYGLKFPRRIIPGRQYIENRKLMGRLEGNVEVFLNLPKLNDRNVSEIRTQNIIKLLAYLVQYSAYNKKLKGLHRYGTTQILNLSINEGSSSDTPMAIVNFGANLLRKGRKEDARKWFNVARELIEFFPRKIGSRHSTVQSFLTFAFLSKTEPLHKTLDPILELNRLSLRNGDMINAYMAWIGYAYAYISVGLPLVPLDSDMMSFSNEARQFGPPPTIMVLFPIFRQSIYNLRVLQLNPTLLKGDIFDQEKELKKFEGNGLMMTLRDVNSFRLMLACIFQDWEAADELISALEPFLYSITWFLRRHFYLVYMGYASVVLGKKANVTKRQKYRQLGKKIIKIFRKLLKDGSSDALPVIMMLEAIKYPSKKRFDEAIRASARLGLVHYTAMINENAGLFFLECDKMSRAKHYLSEASKLYGEWGASGKMKHMIEKYDSLNLSSKQHFRGSNIHGRTRFSSEHLSQLRKPINLSLIDSANKSEEKDQL